MIETFGQAFESSQAMMQTAYRDIPAEYWSGRTAYNYRFDNFFELVERRAPLRAALPSLPDEVQTARRLAAESPTVAIYAGIPWCVQKCTFCDLAYGVHPSVEQQAQYVSLISEEAAAASANGLAGKSLNSAYFGGGTPSMLSPELLNRFVSSVLGQFSLQENTVITCECSPATTTDGKLEVLKAGGVNRVSLGVQDVNTELRQAQGRLLPKERLLPKIELVLQYFDLVNVDVIYGLEGQTAEHVYETLRCLIELGVPSITFYRFELRPGAVVFTNPDKALTSESFDERSCRPLYFLGKHLLESAGYFENPLGWFIKRPEGSAPRRAAWSTMVNNWSRVVPYVGFGQGSYSTSLFSWARNSENFDDWRAAVETRKAPIDYMAKMDETDEFLVKFMRIIRGADRVNMQFLAEAYPKSDDKLQVFLTRMMNMGLLKDDGDGSIALTLAGESLIHCIISDAIGALGDVERPSGTTAGH